MFAFRDRTAAYWAQLRATWRARREVRAAALKRVPGELHLKLCPGCYVPIEKNDGCDHMHCAFCGLHFSWRQAQHFNTAALENKGDGSFRFCPHCNYQNQKLHSLSDARCGKCLKDFKWEDALFVPVVTIPQPVYSMNRTRGQSVPNGDGDANDVDCGGQRAAPAVLNEVVRSWLQDPNRVAAINLDDQALELNSDLVDDVPDSLKCEICATRAKSFALQCGHLFCEPCMVTFLQNNPVCPVDRVVVAQAPIRIYF